MPYMTFKQLKEGIEKLTPEQQGQVVQIMHPGDLDKPAELQPVYLLDTVFNLLSEDGEEGTQKSRSAVDNEHHPEQLVLLCDHNPYDEDGNIAYVIQDDGTMVGDKTGKVYDSPFKPIFEFTKEEAQQILIGFMAADHESLADSEILTKVSEQLYAVYPNLRPPDEQSK